MINTILSFLFDLIDTFLTDVSYFEGNFENFCNYMYEFIGTVNIYMGYLFYFIPKFYLQLIFILIVAYVIVRIVFAIVNIIYP